MSSVNGFERTSLLPRQSLTGIFQSELARNWTPAVLFLQAQRRNWWLFLPSLSLSSPDSSSSSFSLSSFSSPDSRYSTNSPSATVHLVPGHSRHDNSRNHNHRKSAKHVRYPHSHTSNKHNDRTLTRKPTSSSQLRLGSSPLPIHHSSLGPSSGQM